MKQMIEAIQKLPGWCDVPKAITLHNLVLASGANVIVEIGVFGGRSAIPMMVGCKTNGFGTVHCVDPWSAQASLEGQVQDADREWWGKLNHDDIYNEFVTAVSDFGLKPHCKVHRMKSEQFDISGHIDIVHVDGNHGPDALKDTIKYASKVVSGGYVVLDDMNWAGGHVVQSAKWLLESGFIEMHPLGTGALFYKL
jgi:predicted O-methyltransferase YrrM